VATSLPTELLLFAYSGHMINNTRQRKIYGLQVLVTPTSLSLNNTHPWVFTYSYVPRFLPVLYALELVLIAFFFPSYFCNPTLFRRISLGLRNSSLCVVCVLQWVTELFSCSPAYRYTSLTFQWNLWEDCRSVPSYAWWKVGSRF